MTLGDARISEERARNAAERKLRLDIGNLPHLGDPQLEDGEYIFPILISIPRVVFEDTPEGQKATDVKFMSESKVGEISVNMKAEEVIDSTSAKEVETRIKEEKREMERAVQRALIRSASKQLSRLSYPKHRQTPVIEILSAIILDDEIEEGHILDKQEKYDNHIQNLIEVDLVKKEDGYFRADDALKEIIYEKGSPSERLNASLTHLFEKKSDDLDMMNDFLGPYLEVAGYYYQRAFISDSLPKVTLEEFRREIRSRHSGQKGNERAFKTARYLVQLEEIGLLQISELDGDKAWIGTTDIKDDLLEQSDQLGRFSVFA